MIWVGGVHDASIEAEGVVAKVHNTTTTGIEGWVWWGGDAATVALDPELAAYIVAPSNNESGANIGGVPVATRRKVFIDLYRSVGEVAGECGEKSDEVLYKVRVSVGDAGDLPSIECPHRS